MSCSSWSVMKHWKRCPSTLVIASARPCDGQEAVRRSHPGAASEVCEYLAVDRPRIEWQGRTPLVGATVMFSVGPFAVFEAGGVATLERVRHNRFAGNKTR
jgi:hypothetical protein